MCFWLLHLAVSPPVCGRAISPVTGARNPPRTALLLLMAKRLSQPDLSVIVVTRNRSELALRTIRSARAAVDDISVEWHVVDSGSTEPIAERIERQWPEIHVQRRRNAGFAAANNDALRRAEGRYVLLLNPDVEVVAGTFDRLVEALDARPEIGMASVIQRAPDGTVDYSMRRDPGPWRSLSDALVPGRLSELCGWGERDTRKRRYQSERSADWLCGAFLIARAEVVREVGPLDERFFLYSEETDWCYRCRRAGWDVRHLPVMAVIHHRNKSYAPELLAQLSYSKLLFARKHYEQRKAELMRRAVAVHHFVRAAAFGAAGSIRRTAAVRARAEWGALSVVVGRSVAPFGDHDAR
jgi:N-acetylglucosaminyl-diphospho-decaprenol L-rhamnosyltransferase